MIAAASQANFKRGHVIALGIAVWLTKASRFPSGDHDGTLIVPCPPYRYAITRAGPPPPAADRQQPQQHMLVEGIIVCRNVRPKVSGA